MGFDDIVKSNWKYYMKNKADYLNIENEYINYGYVNFLLTTDAHYGQVNILLKKC